MQILRVAVGAYRLGREAARRAWLARLAATWSTIAMQLCGFALIADAGWRVYKPLGLFVAGVLLVWLGNGLEPEPAPAESGAGDS